MYRIEPDKATHVSTLENNSSSIGGFGRSLAFDGDLLFVGAIGYDGGRGLVVAYAVCVVSVP